jgi:hypothetical protein
MSSCYPERQRRVQKTNECELPFTVIPVVTETTTKVSREVSAGFLFTQHTQRGTS